MKILNIEAKKRDEKGKNKVKKLRAQNLIPAIMYGGDKEILLAVKLSDAERIHNLRHENFFVKFKYDSEEKEAIVKEIQLHPVTNKVIHLDFVELVKGKTITVSIPLELIGTPVGVKMGGILERFVWDIEVETIPSKIPEKIEIDISDLNIGDSLHIRDIKVEEGVKISLPPDEVILTIAAPSKAEEIETEEEIAEEEGTVAKEEEKKEKSEGEESK